MNILFCGLGSIGWRHLGILKDLGVADFYAWRTGKSTMTPPAEHAHCLRGSFDNLADALAIGIDAALVTNPTSRHVETALQIAEQGVPLFIEKPLSHDLGQIDELQRVVEDRAVPVLIGYNLIYHKAITTMRALIDEGRIGQVISAKAHWGTYLPGWHPWEDYRKTYTALTDQGGGAVRTLCHELNFVTELFGRAEAVQAMATTRRAIKIEGEEGVEVLIRHDSGVTSNVHLNFFQKPYRRWLEVIGDNGTAHWDFMQPVITLSDDDNASEIALGGDADSLLTDSYHDQMKHFLAVAERKEQPLVPLSKGIEDQHLIMSILSEIGQ